ncbi:hypothetical protein NX059_010824 [Plenodomus lindquistii]|nr:hypothetical protein NX059_010824 [Plenodomus lindquistii]
MYTRPVIHRDLPQIATIAYEAFDEDELYNWLYPGLKQYPDDYRRAQINTLHARLARPGCHGYVVINDYDEVMGYAFFQRATKPGGVNDEGAKIWMQDTWFNKLERILHSLTSTYTSLLPTQNRAISPTSLSTYIASRTSTISTLYAPLAPYWHISVLAISPRFQRRGVGAMLVAQGQKLAREDVGLGDGKGVPMVLESSVPARRLYEKSGFEVLSTGEIGGLEDVIMVWYPEGYVKAEGRGEVKE